MKKKLIICSLFLLVLLPCADAHRLNEFLLATRISLNKNRIGLHINLTAGSGVADQILMDIDVNNDGIISAREQASYVSSVLRYITLTLDGKPAPLQIVSFNFPTVDAIKNGMGDIQLYLTALLERGLATHQLVLKNQQPGTVVYLVNCLLPDDATIGVSNQSRNLDQSLYTIDFTTSNVLHSRTTDPPTDNFAIVKSYFVHGVQHILTGYDHLLFLCALVLGAASLWDLVKIITAFTIAHSVTLTLAVFGLVNVPGYITEPLIAISIIYVAVQNIFWPKHSNGLVRLCAAFLFGLFHGLAFAGGLLQLMHAMPAKMLLYAIFGFSIGIEAGNQLVLIPLYAVLQNAKSVRAKSIKPKLAGNFKMFASAIVAIAGLYYLFISLTFLAR